MFAGHYAAAFAAKAVEPRAPLWTLVAGCQLIDIGWSVFIATGVEHASVDPSLQGSSLVLFDMPWTHSAPGALAWSIAAGVLAKYLLRLPVRAAWLIGATVFSHWVIDLIVHRPDLLLYPGGPKVGFALWDQPVIEEAVEMGLLGLGFMAWAALRQRLGQKLWPGLAFAAFLIVAQIGAMFFPFGAGPMAPATGWATLALYLLITAASLPLDGALQRQNAKSMPA
jgi:hypothetical protein